MPKTILVLNKAYEYLTLKGEKEVTASGSSEPAEEESDIEEIVM